MIRFQLLGSINLRNESAQELRAVLAQPKRLGLLAYLAAASPPGPQRRDTILGMFWPELDQEHARNALSQAVHFLRRWLGEVAIVGRNPDELALDSTAVWTDVGAFGTALDGGRLEEALKLYRGDLLPSFFVPDAPGFEQWLEQERARLRSRAAAAARLLAERHEAGRHLTLAVGVARQAVELSNGDERPLRRLIELLDRLGDRAGALRAYEEFARKLATELEVEPAPETVALVQRIRAASPKQPPPTVQPSAPGVSGPPIARLAKALAHQYKIERELGAGAMAVVALAHDLRHHRRVAIKILRPELSSLMGPERFLREIDIVASLMHPHILPLHDSGEADGLLYYVMPYVEGESLRGRLEREGRLPLEDALQIAREVADALAYAHHRGFVHRDIKPENILLSGGHALVADFGIARAIGSAGGEQLAARGFGTGTPAYMSPEQISGESPVDERTDTYALGCVLYEMLGGQPPFTGPTPEDVIAQRLYEPAPHISRLRQDVSPALDAAIAKALARAPTDRFARPSEFASALTPAQSGVTKLRTTRLWRRAPAALAVLAILAAGGFAGWRLAVSRRAAVTNPHLVAVLPFRVAGADTSLQYLRHGMIDLLVAKLTGKGGPRAADAHSVLAAFRSIADTATVDLPDKAAMRVAERVGAGLLLQGSVAGPPEHLVITASLLDASGAAAKQASVEGPKDSLFVLVDKLTAGLLALDAGVNPQQLSSLTTTSLEALKAYLDGQAAYRRAAFAEATRSLDRAIQIDSTFALAASALIEAQSWATYARTDRPLRLAWRYRHRLSERDQLVLSVRLGARYPLWSPSNLDIAAGERLTQAVPESPEAWHALGDVLFHSGILGGIPDARHRARRALERVLELDSLFAPALTHLISLAAEREDAGEVIRLVPRLLALDSTDWTAFAARWHFAVAQRDERAMATFIEGLRSVSARLTVNLSRGELGDSTGLAHRSEFLAVARKRLANPSERAAHAWVAWMHALNLGRPTEARAWLASSDSASQRNYRILGWVVGGDKLDLDAAGRREKVRAATTAGAEGWPNAPFLMEAWKLFHNDLSSVDRTVRMFRSDAALRDTIRENHLVGAQLLEAWAATTRNSPQALQQLDAADSMLVGRGDRVSVELLNPLVAYLYVRLGSTNRALAAVRRRSYSETFLHPVGLAESSRFEGLWAAQNGDRAGAIVAYRRYLMLRTNPEPSMIPQRDSVRAELARLEERTSS